MIISPSAISPLNLRQVDGQAPFSFGNALQFDGVNDFVETPTISLSSDLTISFYFKVDNSGSQNYGIMGNTSTSENLSVWLRPNSFFRVRVDSNLYNLNRSFTSNSWYHCVITRSGANIEVFFDAISAGVQSVNTNTLNFNCLGRGEQVAANAAIYLGGALDEVAIWDGITLTSTEISDLYNSGSGDFATNYQNANLIAYYRMNQADGSTTLIDEKGTYNGTLYNFSTPPPYFIPH